MNGTAEEGSKGPSEPYSDENRALIRKHLQTKSQLLKEDGATNKYCSAGMDCIIIGIICFCIKNEMDGWEESMKAAD